MATPIPPVPPQLHSPSGNFMALLYAYLLKLVAALVAFFTGSVSTSPTVAALEAQPGPTPNEPRLCIVQQYGSNYLFVPGSALTVDHITVLSVTGGVAGQWILQGGVPSMTTVQRTGLTDPATPLLIWNTTTGQYEYWNGSAWLALRPYLTSTTAAALEALPGPAGAPVCWVQEFDQNYVWFAGSSATVDNFSVLGATGGTAGCWIIQGDLSLSPLGGGLDDAPRVYGAMVSCAYQRKLVLKAGAYTWASTPGANVANSIGATPNGTYLECEPGVTIHSTMTGGSFLSFIFFGLQVTSTNQGVLESNAVVGSLSLSTSVPYAVGSALLVRQAAVGTYGGAVYTVQTCSAGPAPYTVTLDRPVLFAWLTSDFVRNVPYEIRDITLKGNGAVITGGGDFAMTMGGYNVQLDGWKLFGTSLTTNFQNGFSLDICSRESIIANSQVNGPFGFGFNHEASSEHNTFRRCLAENCGNGFSLWDGYKTLLDECRAWSCTLGVSINTNTNSNLGSWGGEIRGGMFTNCSSYGVNVLYANGQSINDAEINDNATYGISLGANTVGTHLTNLTMARNATADIEVGAATHTKITNLVGNGGGTYCVSNDGGNDVDIDGMSGASSYHAMIAQTAGDMRARGLQFPSASSFSIYITGGTMEVSGRVSAGSNQAIYVGGGTIKVHDVVSSDSAGPTIGLYNAGGNVIFGAGNDFTADGTPFRNDNGAAAISHSSSTRFSDNGAIAIATMYLSENGAASATEANVQVAIKQRTTIRDLQINASAAPSAGHSTVYTVRKNGVDTAVTVTLGAAATTALAQTPRTLLSAQETSCRSLRSPMALET